MAGASKPFVQIEPSAVRTRVYYAHEKRDYVDLIFCALACANRPKPTTIIKASDRVLIKSSLAFRIHASAWNCAPADDLAIESNQIDAV